MTRQEWSGVVSGMISRGAKGTETEFGEVIDYLTKNLPPKQPAGNPASPRRGGGGGFSMGPDEKQIIDSSAADRGKALYLIDCGSCHGPMARGGSGGPDLVRSVTLLHDRYGSTLEPLLRANHPMPTGQHLPTLSEGQIKDLSHFLHQQVNDTLRSGPYTKVLNVLTGDAKAGAAYFNAAGTCNNCHSPAGDLAGIAAKYDPATLQQRFLFPRTIGFGRSGVTPAKPVRVTVTTPDGDSTSGDLVRIDDFTVSLRDAAGVYCSWKRTPQLKVEKHDPYAAHDELLDRYTDKDIHNVVAYLETLK